jgi:L-asparaginase
LGGNNEGFSARVRPFISGTHLTASKAHLLLMACLMKFGSLPTAADLADPSEADLGATLASMQRYQEVFDNH